MFKNHLTLCLLFTFFAYACTSPAQPKQQIAAASSIQQKPDRRALFRSLRSIGKLTLVYSNEIEPPLSKFEAIAKYLAEQRRGSIQLEIKSDEELDSNALQEGVYFLIGTPKNNHLVAQLSEQLPLTFEKNSFRFNNQKYTDASDVLKFLFYPNPLNDKVPIYLLTGNEEQAIYDLLDDKYGEDWSGVMRSRSGYEVYQDKTLRLLGYFSESNWNIDQTLQYQFDASTENALESNLFKLTLHGENINQQEASIIIQKAENSIERMAKELGFPVKEQAIAYHLYPSIEQKGLMLNNTDPAHVDFNKRAVHVVCNANFRGDQYQLENELILSDQLGKGSFTALEKGLAIYFTTQWQKKGYAYWAQKLYSSKNLPSATELINENLFKSDSELVMGAAAASFVAFLLEELGVSTFLNYYKRWNPSEKELKNLNTQWNNWLDKKSINFSDQWANKSMPYLKGFNFAHEGYRVYNGYGSKLAQKSLAKLERIGTNAVAIVPYSFMRNPNQPSPIPITQNAGSETDESVIYSHLEATKLGMTTMLKPQLWLGRSWPGDVAMETEEDWQQFFTYYYRWIRHYTLLAEIHQIDIMCLGVEFAKATVQREEDWRQIFKKMRQLYSGKLTYAANWGDEFEKVGFWDEIDYIGIDCYYPLGQGDKVNKKTLKAKFNQVLKKIEGVSKKYNKPLLFTEIGFRSVDETWRNPHEGPMGRANNEKAQQVCYEVVFEGIKGKDWCQGLFWWKWPSYTTHDRGSTGFTPCDKAAEATIKEWFGKL